MRRTKLLELNLLLYTVIVVLVFAYRSELTWSSRALPAYYSGEFAPLRESTLTREATSILIAGGDLDQARRLLEESLAIDPNTVAVSLLGEVYLRTGDLARAHAQFANYNRIDPSDLGAYVRMAEILGLQHREEDRQAVLQRGIDYFSVQLDLYAPRYDPGVPDRFNRKARSVHAHHENALRTLRELR